jgi:peroxiredoxin family protein/TusA-related sulfurtransferase
MTATATATATSVDCRGQRCPAPILATAKAARTLGGSGGGLLEIAADDDAFPFDIRSWCRSSGAELVQLRTEGVVHTAIVRVADRVPQRVPASAAPPPPPRLAPVPVPAPATAAMAEPAMPLGTPLVSIEGVAADERIPRLQALLAPHRGSTVTVVADDPAFGLELVQWAAGAGHRLLSLDARGPLRAELQLAAPPPPQVALVPMGDAGLEPAVPQATLLVLHNDREALLAALLVAVGAAAQGMNVMMFFTFWGLNLLRGENPEVPPEKVSWAQRMFKWMMPKGPAKQKLGKLDMGGMGRSMLGSIMKRYHLMDIPELMATAEEQGVRFVACTMSMQVMGITKHDLAPRSNLDFGGVAAFVESASRSRMSLTF